jgi:hypothetical protein
MTATWRAAAAVTALSISATGCLLKDTTHTWYLAPAGSVTWVVLEQDVRSDAQSAPDRASEEAGYWAGVQAENHTMARALRLLGPIGLRTRILRGEVPFTVVTEARFPSLGELGQRLLGQLRLSGSSVVEQERDVWTWTMTIRDPHAESGADRPDGETAELAGSLSALRVVLVTGRFEDAQGFTLSSDRRIATFDQKAADERSEQPAQVVRLAWTVR